MADKGPELMTKKDKPNLRDEVLSERRAGPALDMANFASSDVDPALGTLTWSSFSRVLEEDRSQAQDGVLLMIDISEASRALLGNAAETQSDVLPLLASGLQQAIRHTDLISYIGGYRFAVLLRGALQNVAADAADRMHQSIIDTVFMISTGIAVIEITIGGASLSPARPSENSVLDRAAANLVASCQAPSQTVIE